MYRSLMAAAEKNARGLLVLKRNFRTEITSWV